MGIDGMSISQVKIQQEKTSAQMANQAEQLAQQGTEFKIKDISEIAAKPKIEVNKDAEHRQQKEEKFDKHGFLIENEEKNDDEIIDFDEENLKNFSVRVNNETEMIELFDKENNRIINTITPEELMYVIRRLDGASGIMVNKKV